MCPRLNSAAAGTAGAVLRAPAPRPARRWREREFCYGSLDDSADRGRGRRPERCAACGCGQRRRAGAGWVHYVFHAPQPRCIGSIPGRVLRVRRPPSAWARHRPQTPPLTSRLPPGSEVCYIMTLGVAPRFRRRGLASDMLRRTILHAETRGAGLVRGLLAPRLPPVPPVHPCAPGHRSTSTSSSPTR